MSETREHDRCAVCGWPLAEAIDQGCVRGNCSRRPLPTRLYDPARAQSEYGGLLNMTRFENGGDCKPPAPAAPGEGTRPCLYGCTCEKHFKAADEGTEALLRREMGRAFEAGHWSWPTMDNPARAKMRDAYIAERIAALRRRQEGDGQ